MKNRWRLAAFAAAMAGALLGWLTATGKVAALLSADTKDAAAPAKTADAGPTQRPVVTKPGDANKPVWTIVLPAGSSAADWIVTLGTTRIGYWAHAHPSRTRTTSVATMTRARKTRPRTRRKIARPAQIAVPPGKLQAHFRSARWRATWGADACAR